jgi:hypothetical protein
VTLADAKSFADGIRAALANWDAYSSNGRAGSTSLDWAEIARTLEVQLMQVIE